MAPPSLLTGDYQHTHKVQAPFKAGILRLTELAQQASRGCSKAGTALLHRSFQGEPWEKKGGWTLHHTEEGMLPHPLPTAWPQHNVASALPGACLLEGRAELERYPYPPNSKHTEAPETASLFKPKSAAAPNPPPHHAPRSNPNFTLCNSTQLQASPSPPPETALLRQGPAQLRDLRPEVRFSF